MARLLRTVSNIGLLSIAFICGAEFLRYSIMYFTTTYRLEWVWHDGSAGEHTVDVVVGEKLAKVLFSNYWTKNNECYEFKIYCGSSSRLVPDDQVEICLVSGSRVTVREIIYLHSVVDDCDTGCYMVIFPERLSPRREGDSLKVNLSFAGMADVVCLEYEAKFVRHCFDIFTGIT